MPLPLKQKHRFEIGSFRAYFDKIVRITAHDHRNDGIPIYEVENIETKEKRWAEEGDLKPSTE